jgi:hypothetical protein
VGAAGATGAAGAGFDESSSSSNSRGAFQSSSLVARFNGAGGVIFVDDFESVVVAAAGAEAEDFESVFASVWDSVLPSAVAGTTINDATVGVGPASAAL